MIVGPLNLRALLATRVIINTVLAKISFEGLGDRYNFHLLFIALTDIFQVLLVLWSMLVVVSMSLMYSALL